MLTIQCRLRRFSRAGVSVSVLAVALLNLPAANAETPAREDLKALLLELKQEHASLAERIQSIEILMEEDASPAATETVIAVDKAPSTVDAAHAADAEPGERETQRLDLSGDLQLRYEGNFSDSNAPDRNRDVMRARLRAEYDVTNRISIGAELSTGAADDPNTAHITLSNFVDDFEVNLSRLYARIELDEFTLIAGKFANPFVRTDLLWDGDVNPQGLSASYHAALNDSVSVKATGIYFIIDEASVGPDSDMIGGQVSVSVRPLRHWRAEGAIAYYDYTLDNLANADDGDFRSNLRDSSGGYLSDFDIMNVIGAVAYTGFGERWPVRVTGEFVKNYGAAVSADEAYSGGVAVGRSTMPGDWRFSYGYFETGVDAVLAAFSNDNLTLATNYRFHRLGVEYTLDPQVRLEALLFHYRPLDALYAGANPPGDWLERLRLNATISF